MLARRFSSKKNFFKFRVSPIVSGAVYISYLAFLISLLDTEVSTSLKQLPEAAASRQFLCLTNELHWA